MNHLSNTTWEPQWTQAGAFHAVQGSIIGITLRQRPAAVILGQGQCKTLFIHAGLPLHLLLSLVKSLDKPEPDAILAKLNEAVSGTSCILTSWRSKASNEASRCWQGCPNSLHSLHMCNNGTAKCFIPYSSTLRSLGRTFIVSCACVSMRCLSVARCDEDQCPGKNSKVWLASICWLLLQVLSMPAQRLTAQKIK